MTERDSDALGVFPRTRWSLVARASRGLDDAASAALDELLRAYWPALKRHLVCDMKLSPHSADDLVQDFVAHKILQRNVLACARGTRGRFRVFLLKVFRNFAVSDIRRQRARKRGPHNDRAVSLDELPETALADRDSHRAFDLDWAQRTLATAVDRMKAECNERRRCDLWEVFACRILNPALDQTPPPSYEELVKRFGFRSPTQASNLLTTAKRMFRRVLTDVVRDTVDDESQVEQEIRDLKAILSES